MSRWPATAIATLEAAAARGWRAPEEARLGRWLLRAAGGFTGRANSALAVGDPGMAVDAAVTEVCSWYRARGLPPMIAVPYPADRPQDSTLDAYLGQSGWPARAGAATVMTAAPDTAAAQVRDGDVRVDLDAEPDDEWLRLYRPRQQPLPPIARLLLLSAPWQSFGSVRQSGHTVAVGRVDEGLGFARHHGYHYRVAPAAPS